MIEITLVLEGKEQDLVIPTKVTFGRLKILIAEALAENGRRLPVGFQLVLKGKSFELGEFDLISDFGISNGDSLGIVLGETNAVV